MNVRAGAAAVRLLGEMGSNGDPLALNDLGVELASLKFDAREPWASLATAPSARRAFAQSGPGWVSCLLVVCAVRPAARDDINAVW
jgi:hypothetical protein